VVQLLWRRFAAWRGRTGRAHDDLGLAAQLGVLLDAAHAPNDQRSPYGGQVRGERLHDAVRLLR